MKVTLVVLLAALALDSAAREATGNDTEKRELNEYEQNHGTAGNYNSHNHGYYYPVHQPTAHYPYFMTPYPTHKRPTSYPTGRPPVPKPVANPYPQPTYKPPTPYPIQHNPYDNPPFPYNPPIHIHDPYSPWNDHQNDHYHPQSDDHNEHYNHQSDDHNDPYNHQTRAPAPHPTPKPSPYPTRHPTANYPTYKPVVYYDPYYEHSAEPSEQPTESAEPSEQPTESAEPSENPTVSNEPSEQPSESLEPSEPPTHTDGPTNASTVSPNETIFGTICFDGFGDIFGVFCQLTQLFPDVAALLGQASQPTTRVDHNAIVKRVKKYLKEVPAERKLNDEVFQSVINHDNNKRSIVYESNLYSGSNLQGGNQYIPGLTPVSRMDGGTPIQQFTVFAPTNYAFLTIPDGILAEVLKPENQDDQLKPILLHHVIANARITFDDLDCGEERQMEALGKTFTNCPPNGFKYQVGLGNAVDREPEIVYKDKETINGIIQTIDEVILPDPNSLTPAPTVSPTFL